MIKMIIIQQCADNLDTGFMSSITNTCICELRKHNIKTSRANMANIRLNVSVIK